ncbi:hypothetical protein T4A_13279 [Trichinella pseudospiralis]|uniref:Uncharacterized protein n=1 Tax=Trichinella pseudospiralis TaxID=6337 RepID=A0A0V1DZP7_TRIPS|nr:hypothetical protein T4A_13279 [Trichinella pseudospiralis]
MLSWIESEARNWKPFIQNRIELIQQLTKPKSWKCCFRSSTVPHFWQSCESNGLAFLIHKELPRLVGSESGELTVKELNRVEFQWIKTVLNEIYAGDLEKKSRLLTLTPVVDDIGLIYVGNRLQRLHLRCQHKYPVILLNKYPFMVVAIRVCINTNYMLMLTNHWLLILRRRSALKMILRKCVICRKENL